MQKTCKKMEVKKHVKDTCTKHNHNFPKKKKKKSSS